MTDTTARYRFSTDRPISSRTEDLLGRSDFANSIASAVKGWRGNDSLVIALYGPWGMGKSSIKNMFLESLRESKDDCPLIVEFNPWQWAGQEQLAEAFFREIGLTLEKADESEDGKKRSARWRTYGSYLTIGASIAKSFTTLLPILGIPGSGVLNILAKGLERSGEVVQKGSEGIDAQTELENHTLSEFKRDISESLKGLKKPILVVIDDIDRLSADEIKLLFQLVKANADFPNIIYLLLFQRDIVEKSLEKIAPISGKEFLEKIVQVGFDIPQIERTRFEKVLFAGLNELLADDKVAQRFDNHRWNNIFIPGLSPYFQTLRDVHRFLSTLSFHVALFRGSGSFEVNPIDLTSLEVLRVFEPEVYKRLHDAKSALSEQNDIESHAKTKLREFVESIINQAPEKNRPQVREILKQLFPPAEWIFSGHIYGPEFKEKWFLDLRICHPDVFDRYFHLAIPEGDISQSQLDRILSLVGDREGLVAEFRDLNHRGLLAVALDRLEPYKEKIALEYAVPFITAIFDIGDELPDEPQGFFSFSADTHASRIILWYLKQEKDPNKRSQLLKEAIKATEGLYLIIRKISFEDRKEKREQNQDAFTVAEEDVENLKKICIEKIRQAANNGKLKSHPKMTYILYWWSKWVSMEEPKEWVKELIDSKEGLLSFLTASLQHSLTQGAGDYMSQVHWFINLKNIEDFASVEVLEQKVTQLDLETLGEKEQRAVRAFKKALKRRKEGKSDDDWRDDENE